MISMLGDKRKRILLVDDHALVRQGLERLLNLGDEFVVCEEAGSASEGMELVRELRAGGGGGRGGGWGGGWRRSAVIFDVGLRGGTNGIKLTKKMREEFPDTVVLVLSAHDDPRVR